MSEQPIGNNSTQQLRSIVERIETIETEIKERQEDRAEIYVEAKSNGFCPKALRTIVRMRKQDPDERREQEAVLESYMHALGMI